MVMKYIKIAFVLSSIIFFSGVLLGLNLDNLQKSHVQNLLEAEKEDIETLQILLLLTAVNTTCPESPHEVLYPVYKNLEDARQSFETFSGGRFISNIKKYEPVARDYLHLNIRAWLMSEELRKRCGSFHTAAFFFVPSEPNSMAERMVLESLKREYGDRFLLFHMDLTQTDPSISSLKAVYNITRAPVTVVDGVHIFKGFANRSVIERAFAS